MASDKDAPSEAEYERSLWLEIVSSDYAVTKKKIQDFGAKEVATGMKDAFFFHIPGGAVFRLKDQNSTESR